MSEVNPNRKHINKENCLIEKKRQKMSAPEPDQKLSIDKAAPDDAAEALENLMEDNLAMASSDISTPGDLIRAFNKDVEVYTDRGMGAHGENSVRPSQKGLYTEKLKTSAGRKIRSPLATVYNNNTPTGSQSLNDSALGSSGSASVKRETGRSKVDETFYMYRSRSSVLKRDVFEMFSDEMVLQVFHWLPKKTLIRCTEVCKRFNQLACDESLWTRMDLANKTLRNGALAKIIYRGVVILRLAQSELPDPVFDDAHIDDFHEFEAKLQFLDLSMCVISPHSLKLLLSKCRKLRKLSLEHVKLDSSVVDEISENKQMEALNLTMCEGLEWMALQKMMVSLTHLQSLNISWTFLTSKSVEVIVNKVNPDLLRLNIAGCRKSMTDASLATLVNRCPGLLELDLSDCTMLTSAAIQTLAELTKLEYLSLSRCYSINVASYLQLNVMPSLLFLDVFGLLSDQATNMLEQSLGSVQINKFMHSAVARPTVGTRRTSIWGLRTRD